MGATKANATKCDPAGGHDVDLWRGDVGDRQGRHIAPDAGYWYCAVRNSGSRGCGGIASRVAEYRTRVVEPLLSGLLRELSSVLIVGPRAIGKTTTASSLAATVVRLDGPAEATAFRADPDAALRTPPRRNRSCWTSGKPFPIEDAKPRRAQDPMAARSLPSRLPRWGAVHPPTPEDSP